MVRTKNNKIVHITVEAVQSGKAEIPKRGRMHEVIFPDIFREIKNIAELSGIDFNTNPLTLRKLFGRAYYSNFPNLIATVDVLGNKSVTTGAVFATEPSKDGYRENLNKLFTSAQGK